MRFFVHWGLFVAHRSSNLCKWRPDPRIVCLQRKTLWMRLQRWFKPAWLPLQPSCTENHLKPLDRSTAFPNSVFCGFTLFQSKKPFLASVMRVETVSLSQNCLSYSSYWKPIETLETLETPFSEFLFYFSSTQKNPYSHAFYSLSIVANLINQRLYFV